MDWRPCIRCDPNILCGKPVVAGTHISEVIPDMGYKLLVTLEHTDKGVVATCDELNAVASGATEEEALENLRQAINALLETYGEEIGI